MASTSGTLIENPLAGPAAEASIRCTEDSVSNWTTRVKPRRKPRLEAGPAVLVGLVVLGPVVLASFGFFGDSSQLVIIGMAGTASVVAITREFLPWKSRPPKKGRKLIISTDQICQYDDGQLVATIDASRDFEYEVLDRYDVKHALFRLQQKDASLTFYFSDPGGAEVVRSIVQIEWPPRNRSAGRSYPPSPA
jgi:hypothetical protein